MCPLSGQGQWERSAERATAQLKSAFATRLSGQGSQAGAFMLRSQGGQTSISSAKKWPFLSMVVFGMAARIVAIFRKQTGHFGGQRSNATGSAQPSGTVCSESKKSWSSMSGNVILSATYNHFLGD